MQALLDHTAAVVIGGIVILVLAVVSLRGQDSSIDAVQYYAQKRMQLDLVRLIERDFSNIGAGVVPVTGAINDFDTTGAPPWFFEFRARPDSNVAIPALIRYEWEPAGTAELSSGTVPTYSIRRLVDGTVSGKSENYLTSFRIDLLTADSTTVIAFPDTRLVRVDFTAVSPLGTSEEIEQSPWTKMFRPVNLLRTN